MSLCPNYLGFVPLQAKDLEDIDARVTLLGGAPTAVLVDRVCRDTRLSSRALGVLRRGLRLKIAEYQEEIYAAGLAQLLLVINLNGCQGLRDLRPAELMRWARSLASETFPAIVQCAVFIALPDSNDHHTFDIWLQVLKDQRVHFIKASTLSQPEQQFLREFRKTAQSTSSEWNGKRRQFLRTVDGRNFEGTAEAQKLPRSCPVLLADRKTLLLGKWLNESLEQVMIPEPESERWRLLSAEETSQLLQSGIVVEPMPTILLPARSMESEKEPFTTPRLDLSEEDSHSTGWQTIPTGVWPLAESSVSRNTPIPLPRRSSQASVSEDSVLSERAGSDRAPAAGLTPCTFESELAELSVCDLSEKDLLSSSEGEAARICCLHRRRRN